MSNYIREEDYLENWCFELDLENEGWIGSGEFGNAYMVSDEKVIKITSSPSEFINAYKLINTKNKISYNSKIYEVIAFENGSYGILMDYLETNMVDEVFSELCNYADERNITIYDLDDEVLDNASEEIIKMSNDLYFACEELRQNGISDYDIHSGNIGKNKDGNYALFDQMNKNQTYDVFELEDIKNMLKEKKKITLPMNKKNIPHAKIKLNENEIMKYVSEMKNDDNYNYDNMEVICFYDENGFLNIKNGYKKIIKSMLMCEIGINVSIIHDQRIEKLDKYTEISGGNTFNCDEDSVFSGLDEILNDDEISFLIEKIEENENKNRRRLRM